MKKIEEQRKQLIDEEMEVFLALTGITKTPPAPAQTPTPSPAPVSQVTTSVVKKKPAKSAAATGASKKAVALRHMILEEILKPSMPAGITFGDVCREVAQWVQSGKYKTKSKPDKVSNLCSQALGVLKTEKLVLQPGGNRTLYFAAE
jgi:hypothetical protein